MKSSRQNIFTKKNLQHKIPALSSAVAETATLVTTEDDLQDAGNASRILDPRPVALGFCSRQQVRAAMMHTKHRKGLQMYELTDLKRYSTQFVSRCLDVNMLMA